MGSAMMLALISSGAMAGNKVYDEASLQQAIAQANANSNITRIIFEKNAVINLTAPVIYNGVQPLILVGRGATVDGSTAGSFVLDDDLTAITEDGTLVFNTAADITIRNLTVDNSATRGIVVNVPEDAQGDDIKVTLNRVNVLNSALYGVHVDDNTDEFDDGAAGSNIGIDLTIRNSNFVGNGTGAIDFDGIRVDERAEGDIDSFIINTHIDANGGDGIELDEAGNGDVDATMIHVTLNDNGFYNEEDLDDGFDIDEADGGDLDATLVHVVANGNLDEGLDFDEAGEGDVSLYLRDVEADNNVDEAIKADEEDQGDLRVNLKKVSVSNSGDDGIQFTELGEGKIKGKLFKVTAKNNVKYGIKAEQWIEEDEPAPVEEAGQLKVKKVTLTDNSKGDEIETNNVVIK